MTRHLAALVGEEVGSEVGWGHGGGGLLGLCMAGVVLLSIVGITVLVCADSASTPTSSGRNKWRFGNTAAASGGDGGHYGGGHHGGGGGHHGGGHHGGGGGHHGGGCAGGGGGGS